jgi:hypothetical protein
MGTYLFYRRQPRKRSDWCWLGPNSQAGSALAFDDRKTQQLFVPFVSFCKSLKELGQTLTGLAFFATFVFKIRIRVHSRSSAVKKYYDRSFCHKNTLFVAVRCASFGRL